MFTFLPSLAFILFYEKHVLFDGKRIRRRNKYLYEMHFMQASRSRCVLHVLLFPVKAPLFEPPYMLILPVHQRRRQG